MINNMYYEIIKKFKLKREDINFKETSIQQPIGLDRIIKENWDKQLKDKQEKLPKTSIKQYKIKPLNALYNKKPDLIGYVPINLSSKELMEIFEQSLQKANDAGNIEFVPADGALLLNYLSKTPSSHFCPPCEAGLVLYALC